MIKRKIKSDFFIPSFICCLCSCSSVSHPISRCVFPVEIIQRVWAIEHLSQQQVCRIAQSETPLRLLHFQPNQPQVICFQEIYFRSLERRSFREDLEDQQGCPYQNLQLSSLRKRERSTPGQAPLWLHIWKHPQGVSVHPSTVRRQRKLWVWKDV